MEIIPFKKSELIIISIILLFLSLVSSFYMSVSIRRGRDSIRKDDISAIQEMLESYFKKYNIYPLSSDDGKIIGCFENEPIIEKKSGIPLNTKVCNWGQNSFESMSTLVRDPKYKDGAEYLYISDGYSYQFYISLEGVDEPEYTKDIINKNLQCGNKICNYGRGTRKF